MENTPRNTFISSETSGDGGGDDDAEKSSDTKTRRKAKVGATKAKELGSFITGEKKQTEKEQVAEKSKSLVDKLLGGKSEEKPEEKPESTSNVSTAEASEPTVPVGETLTGNEQRVAAQLAQEGEIRLHDELAEIPPERDDLIVDQALEIAAAEPAEDSTLTEELSPQTAEAEATDPDEESEAAVEDDIELTEAAEGAPDEDEETTPPPVTPPASSSGSGISTATASSSRRGGIATPPPTPTFPVPPVGVPAYPHHRRTTAVSGAGYQPPFGGTASNPNVSPRPAGGSRSGEVLVTEAERSEAFQRGSRRGLLAGLLVGGGIEHIRHRRREKRMEKRFEQERKEQTKKIETMEWDHVRETEAEKVRKTAAEKQRRSIEQSRSSAQPEVTPAPQREAEEKRKAATEREKTSPALTKAEQFELERQQEQLEIQSGHHIERSAWHNIEVDEYGRAVQEGAIKYGHEYYKERAHETQPKHKQQFDEAAGEVALVAAALSGDKTKAVVDVAEQLPDDAPPSSTSSPRPLASGSSHASGPSATPQQPRMPAKRSLLQSLTSPPTTAAGTLGWFIALVVLIAIFLFVLR